MPDAGLNPDTSPFSPVGSQPECKGRSNCNPARSPRQQPTARNVCREHILCPSGPSPGGLPSSLSSSTAPGDSRYPSVKVSIIAEGMFQTHRGDRSIDLCQSQAVRSPSAHGGREHGGKPSFQPGLGHPREAVDVWGEELEPHKGTASPSVPRAPVIRAAPGKGRGGRGVPREQLPAGPRHQPEAAGPPLQGRDQLPGIGFPACAGRGRKSCSTRGCFSICWRHFLRGRDRAVAFVPCQDLVQGR